MQQKIIFIQGMDSDSSPEYIGEGKARKRINCRVLSSDNDQAGGIEPVLSNEIVAYTLPAGANKVIGSEEDIIRQKVYYFVWNSNGADSILQYDLVSDTITRVLQNSVLNFDQNHLITGIDFIELDENNHLLYWTDNYNEPRKINIEKGILHSAVVPDYINGYPNPFNAEFIFRIKQPMLLSPAVEYGDDTNIIYNRLVKNLFQFKVQFVYDDSELSAWSPISITPFPLSVETVYANNFIKVTVDTGIEIVKRIRIAAKEVNSADYFLAVDLDKSKMQIASNSTYEFHFYNDGNYSILPLEESIKLFDNVPKLSQSQEIVKPVRITDGNIVEGFDPVDIDLQLDFTINEDTLTYSVDHIDVFTPGSQYINFSLPVVTILGDGTGATAEVASLMGSGNANILNNGFGVYSPYVVVSNENTGTGISYTANSDGLGVVTSVTLNSPGSGYSRSPYISIEPNGLSSATAEAFMGIERVRVTNSGSGYTFATASSTLPFDSVLVVALSTKEVLPVNALKRGGDYVHGIIYYDHGNRSGATNSNDGRFDEIQPNGSYGSELFVPFYNESNPAGAADLDFNMSVDGVAIESGGAGYTGATTVTFSAPDSGTTPTGTPIIGTGGVTELTLTNTGSTYPIDGSYAVSLLTLTGAGSGATAIITITGGIVTEFDISAIGTGYLNGDTVEVDPSTFIPPPGVNATFSVLSDYQTIAGVTVVTGTGVYTSMPTVTVVDGGGGTGAIINATMKVATIFIINGSTGYTTAPTATFIGGSPDTIATITTTLTSGVVTSTTITNAGVGYRSFPELAVQGRIYGGSFPVVNWAIYNRPPAWATHFQIARTKNLANSRYIQFIANSIAYFDKDNLPLSFGDPSIVRMTIVIGNISSTTYPSYNTQNSGSILVYDFIKGDRIRFIKDSAGNFIDNYYDFAVDASAVTPPFDQTISVTFPPNAYPGEFPNLSGGFIFEIYQPALATSDNNKLTYEIGEGGYILEDGNGELYHEGETADQTYWSFNASSNNGGFVEFSGATPHGLSPGAKIKIAQNSPFVNSSYNTYTTVSSVTATTIQTNIVFGLADPTVVGVITSAATGTFNGGDTFYRPRTIPYNSGLNSGTHLLEDANYSDLFESKGYDYGRPNRIDKLFKEINRISTIYYSQVFIPETFINGLSSVPDNNFESYDADKGGIYKLYYEDQGLIMYQELKIGNIPVSQIIYNDLQGGTSVGGSESVLSPQAMYYAGEFGIGTHPESFAVYGKAKYCLDPKRGTPVRLSVDGLTPIGDTGMMHNFFTDKCKELMESGLQVRFFGVYDVKFKEYVLSLGLAGLSEEIVPVTLAWNEMANQWSTEYSFIPDNMCSANTDIVTFKDGAIYKHNIGPDYNTFYGAHTPSEFWVYCNSNPSNVKILTAISEETNEPWEVYEITTPNGQSSSLSAGEFALLSSGSGYVNGVYPGILLLGGLGTGAVATVTVAGGIVTSIVITNIGSGYESEDELTIDPSTFIPTPTTNATVIFLSNFEEKENNQYASVLRDVNTPNVGLPLIEGDVMRDRTFLAKFRYLPTVYNKINAVNFYFIASELSNRN